MPRAPRNILPGMGMMNFNEVTQPSSEPESPVLRADVAAPTASSVAGTETREQTPEVPSEMPEIPDDFGPIDDVSIHWNSTTYQALLDVMADHIQFFIRPSPTISAAQRWENVYQDFKLTVMATSREYPEDLHYFLSFVEHINPGKIESKWGVIKGTYTLIRNYLGLTGVGGTDPRNNWEYYDKVGRILENDPSIHPHIVLESMDAGNTGFSTLTHLVRDETAQPDEETQSGSPFREWFLASTATTAAISTPAPTQAPAPAPATASPLQPGIGRGRRAVLDVDGVRQTLERSNEEFHSMTLSAMDTLRAGLREDLADDRLKRKNDLQEYESRVLRRRRVEEVAIERRHIENQRSIDRLLALGEALVRVAGGYVDAVDEQTSDDN